MIDFSTASEGQFCWFDLAATNVRRADEFYRGMFGWAGIEQSLHGGRFTRLQFRGRDFGSMYQLQTRQIEAGVPSHWTVYIRVPDVRDAVDRAAALGADVLVTPFEVSGARIAVIADPVGAPVGLWQTVEARDAA